MSTRVVLVGEFGCGNLGNEASLDALLGWLADVPDVEVVSVTREPERVTAEHGIASVSLYGPRTRWGALPGPARKLVDKAADQLRMRSLLRRGDLVVVPGTGVLEQQLSGPPWGLPLTLAGLALAARSRGARLAVVGVGASPDTRRSVRLLNRVVIGAASWVSARDELSRRALVGYGADPARVRVAPDVAFSLPAGEPTAADAPADGPLRVGLGVLAYHDPGDDRAGRAVAERHEAQVVDFGGRLVAAGHRVEVLTGDAGDVALARRVVEQVRSRVAPQQAAQIGFVEPASYRELIQRCADLDVVVGSRFHNLVFALLNGRPAMSVGYAPKSRALLVAAGLPEASLRIEEADADAMWTTFTHLVGRLPEARTAGAAYRSHAVAASAEHRDAFLAALGLTATAGAGDGPPTTEVLTR